jgi:ketosteroid isomerase-like protein
MKKTLLGCLFGILSIGSISLSQAQSANDATEKAIMKLENQWIESQRTNNPELLAPLLAEALVNTGTDGKVRNKSETLANEKATKYSSSEYEETKVTVFGDTAIAASIWKGEYVDETGKPVKSRSRWTDTWVKMPGGKWQCVATHGSNIEE